MKIKPAIFILVTWWLVSINSTVFAQNDSTNVDPGKYEGKTKKGMRNGYGTCTWKNGRKYVGKWKNNIIHGKGTMTYANGDKYIGDWHYGAKQGYGTYIWSDGSKYTGAFQKSVKSGWGILKLPNGEKHEGYWKNDQANGKGKHYWPNGTQYYGDWKNSKRHGSGVLEYSDGSVVQGEWESDEYIPCKCTNGEDTLSTQAHFDKAEAVFVGTVTEIYKEDDNTDAIVFEITQFWKGTHGFNRKIVLHASYTSCDMIFYENISYLIFANSGKDKFYSASKCSPTGVSTEKIGVVAELEKMNCQQEATKQPIAIRDFDPVCGCDGQTYENPYKAKENGVAYWKKGACKKDK